MKKKKWGFTLPEVMIALTVIGIITAVIVPVAMQSKPDEAVMRFKKGHNTLYKAIKILVTSNEYYCNGDLGLKADCENLITNADGVREYFCNTIADVLSTKKVNCATAVVGATTGRVMLSNESMDDIPIGEREPGTNRVRRTVTDETVLAVKEILDNSCKQAAVSVGEEIVTTDGIVYFVARSSSVFGSSYIDPNANNGLTEPLHLRYYSPPNQYPANYGDQNGFDINYKVFCMDIDGIPGDATESDCVNECPFGYGIRADGKILPGLRAEQWLAKNIQGEE